MAWWQRHFGESTRGRIVALLRRGERSVEDLAHTLDLTDNAVRAQLAILERDGIVRVAGIRRDGSVGKPATLYGMATDAAPMFSAAYAPLLASLLAELGERLTPAQLQAALRAAGRRLAPALPAHASLRARARAGAELLAELGADAELVRTTDGYEIRGHGCVLSQAVAACPATCGAVEELLSEVTQVRVTEQCDRASINCRFRIPQSA